MLLSRIILIVAILADIAADIYGVIRYDRSLPSLTKTMIQTALVFYIGYDFYAQKYGGNQATITENIRILDFNCGRLIMLAYWAVGIHLWFCYPLGSYDRAKVIQEATGRPTTQVEK